MFSNKQQKIMQIISQKMVGIIGNKTAIVVSKKTAESILFSLKLGDVNNSV
jgi:hypothetical protein